MVSGLESFGAVPDRGTVTIHYSMYLECQDEPFDSTTLRGRAERYRLDDGRLIPGLEVNTGSHFAKNLFSLTPLYRSPSSPCASARSPSS